MLAILLFFILFKSPKVIKDVSNKLHTAFLLCYYDINNPKYKLILFLESKQNRFAWKNFSWSNIIFI